MPRRKNKNNKIPLKAITYFFFIISSIVVLAIALWSFFIRSSYFNINKVSIEGIEADGYREFVRRLSGKNIFSQDLGILKKQIEEKFGDVECVAIQRKLPGELLFSLKKRIAVAQLKRFRFYPVDESGAIMAGASDLAFDGLPLILGLEDKMLPSKRNASDAPVELKKAIALILEKNNAPSLGDCRIIKLQFGKQKTSSFFIAENFIESSSSKISFSKSQIEVKFDLDKPQETIRVLGLLLSRRRASFNPQGENLSLLENIEYIDLRNLNSPVALEKNRIKTR